MKKEFARRSLIVGMGLAALGASIGASAEPNYPTRPVRIIVGFPAGTGPDIVARLLAQKLSEGWNNMGVIVDNKPGAGGLIAASEAARATPDGYTLLVPSTGPAAISPVNRDKFRDFGAMQIHETNFARFGLNAQTALDPARSVDAGSRHLIADAGGVDAVLRRQHGRGQGLARGRVRVGGLPRRQRQRHQRCCRGRDQRRHRRAAARLQQKRRAGCQRAERAGHHHRGE